MTHEGRSIKYLNIHYCLLLFAETFGWTFSSIFFYKLGVPIPEIFLLWTLFFLIRLFIRPLYLKLAFGKNLKTVLIIGTIMNALAFPALALAAGSQKWVYVFIPLYAAVDTLYWLVYHAYFAVAGTTAGRGKEVFYRELLIGAGKIAAPLAGALLISRYNFATAWVMSTFVVVLSVIPLFWTDSVTLTSKHRMKSAYRHIDRIGLWAYLLRGSYERALNFTWALVLFIMLGDIAIFGGLIALAIFFRVAVYYVFGRYLDRGHRIPHMPWIGVGLVTAGVIGRVFFAYGVPAVIALDALLTVAIAFIDPLEEVVTYNASKNSHSPLWFQFFAEAGWDIGCIVVLILLALFTRLGGQLRLGMLLCLPAIVALAAILNRYQKLSGDRLAAAPMPETLP